MTLALLEARDRNGTLLGIVPVTHWPVTVGRALGNDLVLDDPHIAPQHLRIDRPMLASVILPVAGDDHDAQDGDRNGDASIYEARAAEPGPIQVEVLDTLNGVMLKRHHHVRGDRFEWPRQTDLVVGRLHLVLRLTEEPVAAETPLPRFAWGRTAFTAGLVAAMVLLQLASGWLEADETRRFLQQVPFAVAYVLGSLLLWAGLWALVTRLFTGHQHFWRHVRITSATFVVVQLFMAATQVLGGVFSWELLARFSWIGATVIAACGLLAHLLVVAPRRRNLLAGSLSVLVLLGVGGLLGSFWLQGKRLSNELYMASLLPPSWRVAPAVPVAEFLTDAQKLKGKIDERLADRDDENASGAEADGDDGDE